MDDLDSVEAIDGRTLTYCRWGPNLGNPIFVLAGTPGGRLVRHVSGEYDRTGVRAITYDRPGYGGSERLPGRQVAHAAADIEAIADSLGIESFAVIGISGGGPHALAAAAGLPDRVARCATIVGVGPFDAPDLDFFVGMDDDEALEWRRTQDEGDLVGPMYQETVAWVETLNGLDDLPANIRSMIQESFSSALAPGPYGMADDFLSLSRPWGFDVAAIACPTVVMIAHDDTTVPRDHGVWIAEHVPRAVLVEVAGGHFGPRVEPEERLLAWAGGGHIDLMGADLTPSQEAT
jgi:pimeloyl-ACP methyl ester carboxylesterase